MLTQSLKLNNVPVDIYNKKLFVKIRYFSRWLIPSVFIQLKIIESTPVPFVQLSANIENYINYMSIVFGWGTST